MPCITLDGDREVMTGELADWLNCSIRTLHKLGRGGLIEPAGRNRYLLKASIRRYAAHMRKMVTGRAVKHLSPERGRW